MKTTNDIILEYMDRSGEADDMESLICNIKTTCESRYLSDEYKISYIMKEIREAGY